MSIPALALSAPASERRVRYEETLAAVRSLLDGETDSIAMMATVVSELHNAFDYFDWTGFYRVTEPQLLVIGPYQGGHGCLRIPFSRGVCGACARTETTILVPDVNEFEGHIACSSSTLSEIVVPLFDAEEKLAAVLDVDSDAPAAFTEVDRAGLEAICADLGARLSPRR